MLVPAPMRLTSAILDIVIIPVLAVMIAVHLITGVGMLRKFSVWVWGLAHLSLPRRQRFSPDYGVRFDQYLKAGSFLKLARLAFDCPFETLVFVLPVTWLAGVIAIIGWSLLVSVGAGHFGLKF